MSAPCWIALLAARLIGRTLGDGVLTRDETRRVITRCFHAAGKGFVFNLLEGDEEESMLYNYWRPGEIEAFCERFEAEVRIVRGYLRGDFTVRLLKRQGTNCQT